MSSGNDRRTVSYAECATNTVSAENGVDYAYRELGDGAVPLVLLQHFRGNLDYWDPPLIDALATRRSIQNFPATPSTGR